jgi:hypothetical protein
MNGSGLGLVVGIGSISRPGMALNASIGGLNSDVPEAYDGSQNGPGC